MRQRLTKLIAMICYWIGMDALFYYLNRKAKRIVTFHNVMPSDLLPQGKQIGLTDTEDSFRMKIWILKSRFTIGTNVSGGLGGVIITFDDGYKNQFEIAGRILQEEGGLPAIVFVAGRMINNTTPSDALVVDQLLHWTHLAPNNHYLLSSECAVAKDFTLTSDNRQQIWQKIIWPSFCKDTKTKGKNLLQSLDEQYPLSIIMNVCNPEYVRLRMTGITETDIYELRERGWIVGWHTYEHYPLSKLTEEEQYNEIAKVPEDMKKIVFSYPYGELDSVNEVSVRIAETAGYPYAVSNVYAPNKLMSKHFLPRMMMDGNFYQCHMELCGLKHFMKTRQLLPVNV